MNISNKSWQQLVLNSKEIRRELHKIPEPCWKEVKTLALLAKFLDECNIAYRSCAKTGLVACIGSDKTGVHTALRADIDGLVLDELNDFNYKSTESGCMHGCGHDGHMATMLSVAKWLKSHEDNLQGPVTLLFQPAEEGGHGAREMIADGALEGVDRIFGWHNWPAIPFGQAVCPPGELMAANGSFTITLVGKGGHASQPELCNDPVLAAGAITVGLQQIVSRRLPPQQPAVVSVTSIDARSGETVIPETVKLGGSVRVSSTKGLDTIGKLIEESASSIALGYNVRAEVTFLHRYPAVVNDSAQAETMQQSLQTVFGDGYQCEQTMLPIMASEDFSYYLNEVPGAFALVGAGDGGNHSIACHNSRYDFNDMLLEPMIRVLSSLVGVATPLNSSIKT